MAPGSDPLAPWLAERLGVAMVERRSVSGGCIHQAWCLRLAGGGRLFAKTNHSTCLALLEAEADGLQALQSVARKIPAKQDAATTLVIPAPLALAVVGDQAVLVLEWLELGSGAGSRTSDGAKQWRAFGQALAALHRHSLETASSGYGWNRDNYIGAGAQPNGWCSDWGRFFVERRLTPQLDWLKRKGGVLRGSDELLRRVPDWLAGHDTQPCLVHGDLWSGNAALTRDGASALFDPAVYRGDREVDLAMAQLFGGFPQSFFQGYEQEWPLPSGHRDRVSLYNLYHLLNHANLFGGSYQKQAQVCLDRLLNTWP